MVGLKTFYILLASLILLSGCLPQVKETQCGDNEAFNSTLRTCVPVVGGPSSFLSIDTFYPTATQTRYKTDNTDVELSVTISNPYAQTYTVEWKRIFYNTEQTLEATKSGNTSTYEFKPSDQSLNLGSHIFAVKLKDSTGAIVDTHTFEVIVTDSPKPIIDTTTISPPTYDATYTPLTSTLEYKFTILNNNATLNGAGYRTEWKLYKSGVVVNSENDSFNNLDPSGKNNPSFNVTPSSLGVGYYILSARVATSLGEVVAEKQWAITVKHPDLSKIISRNIYNSSSSPTFTTTTIAYNGIDYNSQTTYNFIPSTVTTPAAGSQGDYCVSFASSTGTYSTDSDYIMVNFYLDGSTLVYSGFTTALSSVVCLSDASVAELNNVIFTNTNPTSAQTHTLVARVYDDATGTEYSTTDMNSGLGTYPITWNFLVKPQNEKPTVTFGTSTPTCTSSTSTAKSGCSITSDTNFTVNILLSSDDFYTIAANENKFNYSIRLYQNGVKLEECTKTDAGSNGLMDTNGSDGYSCVLNIPSYNATGPINTTSYSYEIQAEISDTDSPLSFSGTTSQTLSWYFPLGSVTEKNTVPTISNWSVSDAAEGGSITFSADISDAERDNFSYTIKYCTNPGCTTNTILKSGTITRTDNTNPYALSISHGLPEDFLLNLTNLNCDDKKRNETCDVEFLLTITDIPHSTVPLSATSGKESSTITNINPAPVLTVGSISPSPTTFNLLSPSVFVGFPLTISQTPSNSITDSSSVSSEKTFRYQWFSKINNGVMNWTKIEGATSYNLNWTPSQIEGSSFGLSLMLCIEDQPESAVSVVNTTDSTCSSSSPSPWTLTVLNNISVVQDLSTAPFSTELALDDTSSGNETAVWYETASTFNSVTSSAAYIAMFGNDKKIHVKKVLVKDRNQIDTINSTLLLSFNALPSGTTHAIKDLSITGNSSELYVAYLASRTGSPQSFYPQVRRIDLSSTTEKSAPNNDGGKFGFDYDGLGLTNNCTPSSECTSTQASSVSAVSFSPTGVITGSIILATPNGNFTLDFGISDEIDTICSNCSGDVMAQNLRDIINSSTNPLLAGYSATASGQTVTIYGARSGDYYDSSSGTISRIADRLGKIYIAGPSWYLPFIDSSLGGSYNDKISFYYGSTGGELSANTPQIADALNTTGLSNLASATSFENHFDGTNLWISLIKKSGGEGEVYKLDSSLSLQDSFEIFPDEALIDIKVAASSSYVYVGATKSVGENISLGIYDINGVKEAEFVISDPYHTEAGSETSDFFNSNDLSDYKIIPYNSEARIVGISQGTTVSNYKLYLARLREVSSTWTLSCGDCAPISEFNKNVSSFTKLGVSSIRNKTTPSTTVNRLSSDGSVTSQGIRDVVFVSFGRITDAGTNSCDPALGVFNVEGESISATSLYDGTDGGLYRPPLVKN